nr:MAG TPA: hypothetical protein [Caudoviricetes sp.]
MLPYFLANETLLVCGANLYWSAGEPILVEMQTNIGRCVKLYRFAR